MSCRYFFQAKGTRGTLLEVLHGRLISTAALLPKCPGEDSEALRISLQVVAEASGLDLPHALRYHL